MNYGQKYRVGQRAEARINDGSKLAKPIILHGRIVGIKGGEYVIDWGDFGKFHYPFKLIDKPNMVNNIFIIDDGLPEDLFTL